MQRNFIDRRFPLASYQKRRQLLLEKMRPKSVALIPASTPKVRNFDSHYFYRQDSNFYYMTGFNEEDSLLVLMKNHPKFKSAMFLRPKNAHTELWEGKMLGLEAAPAHLGVDVVFPMSDLEKELPELLLGHDAIYLDLYNLPKNEGALARMMKVLPTLSRSRKNRVRPPSAFEDITSVIGELRLVKTAEEIDRMQLAGDIANKAHRAAMAFAKPGLNENQVEGVIEGIYRMHGAYGNSYRSIVATGENALCLHYVENNCEMKDGDLLLIDAGCDVGYYASDVTRTFPVNGKFTGPQKDIYQLVLDSQKRCIDLVRPGRTSKDNHQVSYEVLTQGLMDLKILKGSFAENMEKQTVATYFPHGTGHWIGLDVHDNSPYLDHSDNPIKFVEGMVFTVEPGLYIPVNDLNVPEQFRGIGVRIEDDIMVTATGHRNLTSSIPKEIKDVEEACRQNYRDFLV